MSVKGRFAEKRAAKKVKESKEKAKKEKKLSDRAVASMVVRLVKTYGPDKLEIALASASINERALKEYQERQVRSFNSRVPCSRRKGEALDELFCEARDDLPDGRTSECICSACKIRVYLK